MYIDKINKYDQNLMRIPKSFNYNSTANIDSCFVIIIFAANTTFLIVLIDCANCCI